jgi:2-hydroxy-3-oxopropionate reductase
MQRIGVIGIGNVGSGFAQTLLEAGYPLTVLDRDREKAAVAIEKGAHAAAAPGEVVEKSDIILLCLPGSPPVEAVMDGDDGILSKLRAGQLVIDTGTTRPETDIRYEALCAEKGAGFIDAPITGRGAGWIIMAGGAPENFERGREVLSRLSYKLQHIGPIGHGQRLKLANQLVLAGQWAVWGEAIEFTRQAGLDPRLLRDCLEFQVPEVMYGDDFTAGGHLALHYKDLGYIVELAHDCEANIPMTALAHEMFKGAKVAGHPNWGQAGVIAYWRKLNAPARED